MQPRWEGRVRKGSAHPRKWAASFVDGRDMLAQERQWWCQRPMWRKWRYERWAYRFELGRVSQCFWEEV
jgi:hypothetical protein